MGMGPFGSLLAGSLAHALGAPAAVLISGTCCIGGAALFLSQLPALRREIRAHYARQLQTSPAPIVPAPPAPPESEAA